MRGEYKTKARSAIMDYLKSHAEERFTAGDIYRKLNEREEGIDRATVYRNLDRLWEEGALVRYREADNNATLYQFIGEKETCNQHMHAQCSECGKIFHLENDFVEDFTDHMHSVYGIDIDPGKTMIVGKCEECRDGEDCSEEDDRNGN